MQILVNADNEIVSFAMVGGFDNGIEVDGFPSGFIDNFTPKYYKYVDGEIIVNQNYIGEPVFTEYPQSKEIIGNDEELRKLFANMQIQIVQANMMVAQLSQQNSDLTQEVVQLSLEIEKLKEVNNDENVIS